MQAGKYYLVSLLSIYLISCVSSTPAPVHSDDRGLRDPRAGYRTVVPGDTLYSIAWETGRDYRQLAKWNNIDSSYLIKPGQKILLFLRDKADTNRADSGNNSSRYRVARGDTLYSIARRHGLTASGIAARNNIRPPYRIMPGQVLILANGGHTRTTEKKPPSVKNRNRARPPSGKIPRPRKGKWLWPTQGKLIGKFTGKGKKKGIEISGKREQAILASAAGTVVYQGSGLRGYGRLIILKHDDDYLSAYAHCENIYVKEGDVIQQGSRIASMGDSGTNKVMLHFEIRYKGNPVNPLKYLSH